MSQINHTNQNVSRNLTKERKNYHNHNHDPWGNQDVHIVDNVEHCQAVVNQLRLYVKCVSS